ncbi:MAG TPA: malonic semialdehyde reductase [Kofleriaceae bacterium]|jgi:3-hydroxypropanoate dehydrogenase
MLDQIFTNARTHSAWLDKPVDPALLQRAYDLAALGPTGGNAHPLRIVFVSSADGKAKLLPAMMPGNVDKTRAAPVTAILAWDHAYYEQLPKLSPHRPEQRDRVAGMPVEVRDRLGTHSALLGAGYFILAARAVGLDCGPMGGFDAAQVDAAFLAGTGWSTLLLCNLGYGDPAALFPRLPRLAFADACRIV